jgi:hypothetical protein
MTNLNLVDPNKVVLGENHPFTELGNGIPSIQDIRSYVQLTMHPKNSNYIEILDGNVVGNSSVDSGQRIILTGYHTQKDTKNDKKYNYYSTNYTEDNYKNQDGESEYEGFGIKNIDITFDANKIPQVAISFYDVRGNVLNNFNSKFAKMFQLPYPIFELRIKGGFGPTVTYRLQKIRDDISIDDSGNYTVNSKFIGDRFAPLSDLPLNYLQAVPYLDNQSVDVADNVIKSFHELMINSKRLYEKLNQEINSDNEVKNQEELTKLTDKLRSLTDIITVLNTESEFISGFTGDERYNQFDNATKTRIKNYLDLTTIQDNKISLKQDGRPPLVRTLTLTANDYNFISDIIIKQKNSKNSATQSLGYGALLVFNSIETFIGTDSTIIPVSLDYTKLEAEITKLRNQITQKSIENSSLLTNKLKNLVKDNLGGKRLTIGDIFSLLFQDYNKLMKKIFEAGNQGFADDAALNNRQTYDKIGFPTVVENGKLIYPGASSRTEFKNWPEVKLIEDFINAFVKSQVNNLLTDLLLSKNEDGSSKYIPINPREIYKLSNDVIPLLTKANIPQNVYFSKTPPEICKLIYERFLIFTNINLNVTAGESDYADWTNGNNDTDLLKKWVLELFNTGVSDTQNQKSLFLSTIAAEARNIAFALMIADDDDKNYFINLSTQFTGFDYFAANKNQPLSSTKNVTATTQNNMLSRDYVTVYDAPPQLITDETSGDIITTYMKGIHELNGKYKVTKDNLFYIDDELLKTESFKSDYYYESITPEEELSYLITLYDGTLSAFDFKKLYTNSQYPAVLEIPKGMLIVIALLLRDAVVANPNQLVYDIEIETSFSNPIFKIIKNSNFYNYLDALFTEAASPQKGFGYLMIGTTATEFSISILDDVPSTDTELIKKIKEYIYTPIYLSVNSKEFTQGIQQKLISDDKLYAQYLKQLLNKLAQLVKDDKKTLEDKLKNYRNQMQDNDIKLSMYKSFQVIYENYLYGSSPVEFEFDTKTNFKFIDRAYNDISTVGVLDIKTLLSDTQDTNVSLLTAISRLLSDNNYWFYPFQGFLTTTENYDNLFKIDYGQTITTKPMFVAMYVGGLSSNPIPPPNATTLANDGILKDAIPDDFGKSGATFNAFSVKYTGTQNQIVFSDFQHSTESLKNTDEGLRIQSEIIGNASNSLAIPKGQSLLTVYQKQSYTSTVKIPFGNMGIQPTQYYYLEFIPIFEGLYIIYNVSHNINSDTQRLETTFKGYRLKKDVNPIITSELVDFTRDNFYTQTLNTINPTNSNNLNVNSTSKSSDRYDNTLSYEQNARNFVLGNEGFTAYIYWDIDAWRLGYGSQVMALNSSLTAVGNDIYNPKHYITLPTGEQERIVQGRKQKFSTKWPITYDLNTGKVGQIITLKPTHTLDNRTFTANNGHQWNPVVAGKSKNDTVASTYTRNFYTKELADNAFYYSFKTIYSDPIRKNISRTGYDSLSNAAKIAVGYIAYGFGSIRQEKIKTAITNGNDLEVAKAIVESLVIREGSWGHKLYWRCAKYIDSNIYNKLTDDVKAKVVEFSKNKKFLV